MLRTPFSIEPLRLWHRRRLLLATLGMQFAGTTPTSMVKRLTGDEAFTDALNWGSVAQALPAGSTVGGYPLDATNRLVSVAAATTTLTLTAAAHGNRVVSVGPTAGLAITPPAPTGTGILYTIVVNATVTGGNLTIDAKAGAASAIFAGIAQQNKTGTGLTTTPTASNTNLITLNGSTTGGIVGDVIELLDVGTNVWNLFVLGQYTGTFATPFSNH